MTDDETARIYERATFGTALELGERPAVLVIDLACGFTDPSYRLGTDCTDVVEATKQVLDAGRARGVPAIFTAVGFDGSGHDGGLWPKKMPSLHDLVIGTEAVEIDPRLERRPDEPVIVKRGASGFFGTNLSAILVALRVDTVILCGVTTSGCIRATAVDLLQHGFPTIVPRECVGDRVPGPHEANLFDIQAKYADVVSLDDALAYVEQVAQPARA
ncbi:MAG: maleamate amidohydrolase [Solirubrobacteraceae bacterium]|jgi:nicotinamidase-related amidase|nr:maleamate amidohydrolase [Solirubrobacteraceae bacterium]